MGSGAGRPIDHWPPSVATWQTQSMPRLVLAAPSVLFFFVCGAALYEAGDDEN